MIYAVRAEGTAFIKFGRATKVGKRLAELQQFSPHELFIEAVANWPNAAEKAIHKYLEPLYVRGEWYRDGELTELVMYWMSLEGDGLELLEKETGKLIKRTRKEKKEMSTAPTLSIARARERRLSPEERRIAARLRERREWWAMNEVALSPRRDLDIAVSDHNP